MIRSKYLRKIRKILELTWFYQSFLNFSILILTNIYLGFHTIEIIPKNLGYSPKIGSGGKWGLYKLLIIVLTRYAKSIIHGPF